MLSNTQKSTTTMEAFIFTIALYEQIQILTNKQMSI